MKNKQKYLIEGLVVIITLCLLLIAVFPKFKEAQFRARKSRIFLNLEQTRQAINAYYVDHHTYPIRGSTVDAAQLTTPVSYIDNPKYLYDPCHSMKDIYSQFIYLNFYHLTPYNRDLYVVKNLSLKGPQYLLFSLGISSEAPSGLVIFKPDNDILRIGTMYSPTNGLNSLGFFYATDQGVIPVE